MQESFEIRPGIGVDLVARCPAGSKVIGGGVGGALTDGAAANAVVVVRSYPTANQTAWRGALVNNGSEAVVASVYALCARVA